MKTKLLLISLLLSLSSSIGCMFINTGKLDYNNSNGAGWEFENAGSIICNGENFLTYKKLTGNGLIEVKTGTTHMDVDEFLFTGVIYCDGELNIYCKNPVDKTKVIQRGNGKINFWAPKQIKSNL